MNLIQLLRLGRVGQIRRRIRAALPGSRLTRLGQLALVLFLLMTIHPLGSQVILDPPQQAITSNPVVGVHTRLTDEVEEWKIQATLRLVREMGAPWIVEFFPWPYIEPEDGAFNWDHADVVVKHAENQGLALIARLGWVPEWARPDREERETTVTYLDADRFHDFAEFVAAFAARYRGRIHYVIVWNEPNLSFEWGYRPVDPEGYVGLLAKVYPLAHAANPEIVVLAGALAPTLEPVGSPAGLNDLVYLERMYQAGAAPLFDGLAAHAYGLRSPPVAAPEMDVINFRRVELLREIMIDHGDDQKPVFVTEAGWNDHPRWTHAVRPAERIRYTIGAYEWASQHWEWCPVVAMWAFRYPAPTLNYQENYSFVMADFQPRAIYLEVQQYARWGD